MSWFKHQIGFVFRFQIRVWTCSACFSISIFWVLAGLSSDCPAAAWILVSALRFLVADPSLDPVHSLVDVFFLVFSFDCLAPAQICAFQFAVPDSSLDLMCSLVDFQFAVSSGTLVRLLGFSLDSSFMYLVSDSGLDLRLFLNFWFPVSGWALVRMRLQPGFRFLVPGSRF